MATLIYTIEAVERNTLIDLINILLLYFIYHVAILRHSIYRINDITAYSYFATFAKFQNIFQETIDNKYFIHIKNKITIYTLIRKNISKELFFAISKYNLFSIYFILN